jgi:hypothetical protein
MAIGNNELLHRGLWDSPKWWNKKNKLTTAVFKDNRGVSCERNGSREDNDIKESLSNTLRHRTLVGEVRVHANTCEEVKCVLIESNNSYHVDIYGSATVKSPDEEQALHLLDNSTIKRY